MHFIYLSHILLHITMAYSISAETEKDNFSRFAQGILGPGTTIARDVLRKYITPKLLSMKVKNGNSVWYRLNRHQISIVKNATADGYSKFDITLVYFILRNICSNLNDPSRGKFPTPTKGWGRPPQPGDISMSDDIERIRILRNNVLAHVSKASLKEAYYQTVWQELRDIASRMEPHLGKSYVKDLQNLEAYKMTDAQWKELFKAIESSKDNLNEDIVNMTRELTAVVQSEAQETRNQIKRINSCQEIHCSENEIDNLRNKLLRINECETQTIPVSPLQKSMTLPIDLLYVSVVVKENLEYHNKGKGKRQQDLINIENAKLCKESSEKPCKESSEKADSDSGESEDEDSYESHGSTSESSSTEESEDSDQDYSEDSCSSLSSLSSIDEDDALSNTQQRCDDHSDDQPHSSQRNMKIVNGPEEIFFKEGQPVRYAFMLGKAAHGKAVYCLRLLQHWCNAQSKQNADDMNDWEEVMKGFDFIFFVPLRYVHKSRATVSEMIIYDIFKHDKECQKAISHVMSSEEYRCLIIIDGLDEWNPTKGVIDQLTCKGMPNFENMSNCTIFMTSRPWKFHAVAEMVRDSDRVFQILGLNDNQLRTVVNNVLTNYYGVTEDDDDYKAVYREIVMKSKEEKLKSFMRIPLLAIAFVQISFEKKNVRESLTSFYIALIDLIIKRAFGKDQVPKCYLKQSEGDDLNINSHLHRMIDASENMKRFLSILLLLGKVAFESLRPKAGKLVFTTEDLLKAIGEKELQFSLYTGLLTKTEAPSSFNEENVKISFFHKTLQEFLAAFYLAHNERKLHTFTRHLSNLKCIMEFSYVITFISGLEPSLGAAISKTLLGIVERDKTVCRWIEKPNKSHWGKVEMFFELQVICYKEIKYSYSLVDQIMNTKNFTISIVYLDVNSDNETMNTIAEALRSSSIDISHLSLARVRNDNRCGISDIVLKKFLTDNISLKSLTVVGDRDDRTIHQIKVPSLINLELSHVKVHSSATGTEKDAPLLLEIPSIRTLKLCGINLADRPLGLSSDMKGFESIQCTDVQMSERSWRQFFNTLNTLQQQFNVTIRECNIDVGSQQYIQSFSGLTVTNRMDEISSESIMEISRQ